MALWYLFQTFTRTKEKSYIGSMSHSLIGECEIFLANIKLSTTVPSFEVQYFLGEWGLPSYTVLDSPDEWDVPAIQLMKGTQQENIYRRKSEKMQQNFKRNLAVLLFDFVC